MTAPRIVGDPMVNRVNFAFDGSIAVALYDLMYHDTNDVKPASSQADAGTEALNRSTFAPNFAGLAGVAKLVTDAADTQFPVITDAIVDMDCDSSTFEVGDLVTTDESAGGVALENQKVSKTTDERIAIGYCVKREASATTRVRVRLISRVAKHSAGVADQTPTFTNATTQVLTFDGATGINEIVIPTNLADALSLESSAGDIFSVDTTTGIVVFNFGAAVRVNVAGDAQIGSATTDLVAFHGSTPTDQCAAYTQTFATADRTHAARTATARTVGTLSGTANGAMEAVGDTMAGNVGPAISNNFQELFETINALIVDVADTASVVNAIVDDLQEKGLVG